MPEINGISLPFIPAGGLRELKKDTSGTSLSGASSFEEIFKNELNEIKFSNHAQSRLNSREMELTHEEIARVSIAMEKAESNGSIESLILLKDKSLIVSIPNKTVITIINNQQMSENIITNIDSAVFA